MEPYAVPTPPAPAQKPFYSVADTVYAWLSLLFAFLFCQAVPVTRYPLGGFLLIAGLFAAAVAVFRAQKLRLYPVCILTAISALTAALALLLTDTPFLVRLAYAYSLACYGYFIYAALNNRIEQGFSDLFYLDFIKLLFILPFSSLAAIFPALSNDSAKKGSRLMLRLLIGVAIAIIPTVIVMSFLSYDEGFMKLLKSIFSVDGDQVGHFILSLMFTLPLAMYGFGLYAGSKKGVLQGKMTAEGCRAGLEKARVLPQLTAVVAVLPILFLYGVFFISQWQYYISGFTGVLPEAFSYAEYARQGFFELCSVSVVNVVIIAAIGFFIRRKEDKKPAVLQVISLLFCLCTLILIATALSKLVMYIRYYGLTQKRIYAMWLMALIAIIFLIIAAGQFIRRLKVVALSAAVFAVLFTGLCLCNVNALAARYNTARYLSGSLETLDIQAMQELGDSAVPSLVRVAKALDPQEDEQLKIATDMALTERLIQLQETESSVFSFSIPSLLARRAFDTYTPQIPPAGVYGLSRYFQRDNVIEYGKGGYTNYLILNDDGTGTLYYIGRQQAVTVEAQTLSIDGVLYDFSYTPAEDDAPASLWLHSLNLDNIAMILYATEDVIP